jgi:hypothetical protein
MNKLSKHGQLFNLVAAKTTLQVGHVIVHSNGVAFSIRFD